MITDCSSDKSKDLQTTAGFMTNKWVALLVLTAWALFFAYVIAGGPMVPCGDSCGL